MQLYVRGKVTLQDEYTIQLDHHDELIQEGGDICIYLDYYQWDWSRDVKYFPFRCPLKHKLHVRVKDF